ncbi:MAG TPA: glycoside hydrolase family 15 protein [Polyangiaceae bacterium]
MSERIEEYALIGDCQTAALVSRAGSIDWMCLPRFDSGACFAAILGTRDHGRWVVAPTLAPARIERSYRKDTLVLDTTFHVEGGAVKVSDFMPVRHGVPRVVRIIEGLHGSVRMRTELVVRFDYGSIVPWVRKDDHGIVAIAGADSLHLDSEIPLHGEGFKTVGEIDVAAGQTVAMCLTWHPSHVQRPRDIDPREALQSTISFWREWASHCTYEREEYRDAVMRSLITLKALTHAQTGGIVAAPTTSLPEQLGGIRNWDYRYCWVRDATFTLFALVQNGYLDEARAWREWLLRALAGDPAKMQILYGVDGERRVREEELPWLPGYENSRPVRAGNAAIEQRQLDVYGEIMDALHQCHRFGLESEAAAWDLRRVLLEYLESCWDQPDEGIWEVRGPQRQFTHSKVMAWVAFDRAVRRVEHVGGDADALARWRAQRDRIHEDVCTKAFDTDLQSFVQYYGSKMVDASLLMIPMVGFLEAKDPRVQGTVRAIEKNLLEDGGFVRRYRTAARIDGLPEGEGVFLPCSFWLADNYALAGRHEDARVLFEKLLSLRNDVGLLSEEYDPVARRLVGNFPQAFTHVSLVNSARSVANGHGNAPARLRREP